MNSDRKEARGRKVVVNHDAQLLITCCRKFSRNGSSCSSSLSDSSVNQDSMGIPFDSCVPQE